MTRITDTSDEQRRKELRGKTPEEIGRLMAELERISLTREDWVVPANRLAYVIDQDEPEAPKRVGLQISAPVGGDTAFASLDLGHTYGLGRVAHEQVADKLGIPQKYYDRCANEEPELLALNVNTWMGKAEANYLVRTLDGNARAFLSDRYRTLDDYDFALQIASVCQEVGATVTDLRLSDERFYFRALMTEWGVDLGHGDILVPGVAASNSSVGRGGLNIAGWIRRTICSNGMEVCKGIHRIHLGERRDTGLQLSAEAQAAADQAIWLEVRDMTRAMFDKTLLEEMVERVLNAKSIMLAEPVKAVENVAKYYGLSDDQKTSVLSYMMAPAIPATESGNLWGLVNGVTQLQHAANAEEAARLESIGGELLENNGLAVVTRRDLIVSHERGGGGVVLDRPASGRAG